MNLEAVRAYALARHSGQTRRDKVTPYFVHVEAVARKLRAWGMDERYQAVGYAHDLVEDGRATFDDLRLLGFDLQMIEAVELLTHSPHIPYGEYVRKLSSHKMARNVKLADILANMQDSPTPKQAEKYEQAIRILMGVE